MTNQEQDYEKWEKEFQKTQSVSDIDEREAKIARISRDPKPEYAPPPVRDYPTTELHYICCYDEEKANASLPDAQKIHNSPHRVGAFLASDRLHVPEGWFKTPPRGTPLETIRETYPAAYAALTDKKATTF